MALREFKCTKCGKVEQKFVTIAELDVEKKKKSMCCDAPVALLLGGGHHEVKGVNPASTRRTRNDFSNDL